MRVRRANWVAHKQWRIKQEACQKRKIDLRRGSNSRRKSLRSNSLATKRIRQYQKIRRPAACNFYTLRANDDWHPVTRRWDNRRNANEPAARTPWDYRTNPTEKSSARRRRPTVCPASHEKRGRESFLSSGVSRSRHRRPWVGGRGTARCFRDSIGGRSFPSSVRRRRAGPARCTFAAPRAPLRTAAR